MVKLIVKGFVEEGEEVTNIPANCPKCGSNMRKTDVLSELGYIFTWCPNSRCRYCEVYGL